MFATILATLALAAPADGSQSTRDRWASYSELRVETDLTRRITRPLDLTEGPATLHLESGWLVPVFNGRFGGEWEQQGEAILRQQLQRGEDEPRLPAADERGTKQLVGFVWVGGDGRMEVRLDDRGDALAFADHMVIGFGADPAAWSDVAHRKAPLRTPISEALLLSIDPRLEALFLDPNEDPSGVFEVLVYAEAEGKDAAGLRAKALFANRKSVLDHNAAKIAEWLAWDRVCEDRGVCGPAGQHFVLEALTPTRFGFVVNPDLPAGPADRWLSVLRDDSGLLDARCRSIVAAIGWDEDDGGVGDRIGCVPHPLADPSDPTSAPLPPVRIDADFADVKIHVTPRDPVTLDIDAYAKLEMVAVGGDQLWFDLDLPRTGAEPGSWRIESLTLPDGTSVIGSNPLVQEGRLRGIATVPTPEPPATDPSGVPPDPTEPRRNRRQPPTEEVPRVVAEEDPFQRNVVRAVLPKPVKAGERVVLMLHYRDTWPVGAVGSCGAAQAAGPSTGMRGFLPEIATTPPGGGWRFRLQIGLDPSLKMSAAASGTNVREWNEGGWQWLMTEESGRLAHFPELAVGKWHRHDEGGIANFPAVRTRLFTKMPEVLGTFAPETRRVVAFYQDLLTEFPVREVEIFESPATCDGFVWVAPSGMVNLSHGFTSSVVGGPDEKHLTQRVFAHELAHQYWGHLSSPGSIDDFWIAETFAETYACLYINAAFGKDECRDRLTSHRKLWEQKGGDARLRRSSLSSAYRSSWQPDIVYRYGPYVFLGMLGPRIGAVNLLAALAGIVREHPHEALTSERLQHYLELTSGKDLDDFFAFWVYAGYRPALRAEYHIVTEGTHERAVGTVRSDVPFGTFDVKLRFRDKAGQQVDLPVTVRDGVGTFQSELLTEGIEVWVDPDEEILARARVAKKVDPP